MSYDAKQNSIFVVWRTIEVISRPIRSPPQQHLHSLLHRGAKNAPFYFCNNFVKLHYIWIIFGTQMLK